MIVRQRIKKTDGSIKYRQYLKQNRLGKGGFAECFQVQRIGDKKKYALKIVSKKLLQKPKARQKMLSQIKLHQGCKHRNICQLQRVFEDQDFVFMLLQLCSNGNMFQMIKRRKKLTIPQTQFFIYQLIDSLCYLHNRQLIHRDVKLGNLLIDSDMNLKLADFGLTTKIQYIGDRKHTVCGTPNYIAPQIIRSSMGYGASGHSYQVDVWSTGIIMYLMLMGKAPFQTTVVQKTYQKIAKGQFQFPDSFKDESGKDLLRRILIVDPSKRYTFAQILSHPFMNPKCGIPKQLPQISYSQAPKFGVFQKYVQDPVKQSARNASVATLRSNLDQSMDEDMSGFNSSKGMDSNRSSSKDRKGLFKSIFSTDTISNTIKKLTDLGRSPSPQNKTMHTRLNRSSSSIGRSKSKESFRANNTFIQKTQRSYKQEVRNKQLGYVYVLEYRQDVVWNYILSNGYVGTYEPNYKIIFNKHDGIYFQVDDKGELKKIKRGEEIMNQNIVNRKKFIKQYKDHPLQCEPFTSSSRVVYIIRIYKVQSQNIILFKLSNQNIQAYHLKKNIHLLLTNQDLIMIQLQNGREVNRFIQKKYNYARCSTKMLDLYLVVKKILLKISNAKKNSKK